jgi:hypothetical protein
VDAAEAGPETERHKVSDDVSPKPKQEEVDGQVFYYPARLLGNHASVSAALKHIGCDDETARLLVDNARVNQSPTIIVGTSDPNDGTAYAITPADDGTAQLWLAAFGTRSPDLDAVKKLVDTAAEGRTDKAVFAVFWNVARRSGQQGDDV